MCRAARGDAARGDSPARSGLEDVQRWRPQTAFLAHFELGPGDDSPGRSVLSAVGAFVAMEAPGPLVMRAGVAKSSAGRVW